MILYIKDSKKLPTPKLLETINNFSEVGRYEITLEKKKKKQKQTLHLRKVYTLSMNKLRKNIGKKFHLQ
jgi:hypothetical protein